MASFVRNNTTIHYEDSGSGPALLLIAPGGMRSHVGVWEKAPFNPLREFAAGFRTVAMDQRNAGQSHGPIEPGMGWDQHTQDQLALLDELGIQRFLVMGMCIGGAYIAGLIRAAKERVMGAVLLQPIGLENNRDAFHQMFDNWAVEAKSKHPQADFEAYKFAMFGSPDSTEPRQQFLFNASRDEVRAWTTPILVAKGNDLYHPESTSREVVRLARNASLIEEWKQPDSTPVAVKQIGEFLTAAAD
ncbi:MAG: alpha/beta hydrolase [Polyangiaceae bacterium]|nr:alpha/beta hydrolase [Myxococcales bacterium]MCB9584691.1 alpha/beta hydrolase [Polyangiaceae bacterium]MCB9609128.1 alpha/beta hydrolase [Polyangiaceae bacterium]